MIRSRIIYCAVAGGLMLGLSACTNPYDPVQRFVGGGLIGAGSGSPDCSPTAGTDQTAANKTLHRIVGIGASRQTQHQPAGDCAVDNP